VRIPLLAPVVALLLIVPACGGGGGGGGDPLDPVFSVPLLSKPFASAVFSGDVIDNPLFPLIPGTRTIFEGDTADGREQVVVEVTYQTKVILGVTCVVVHDQVFLDGSMIEDTFDWFAQSDAGDVWYFGEDSKEILNGVVQNTNGSFEAGVNGASAGIIMLAAPAVGQAYAQEDAPGIAEDRAHVEGLLDIVTVPLATYNGCLHTRDFTPLEPDHIEDKYYATGVGNILTISPDGDRIELIAIEMF